MPELPEVETVCRGLARRLIGRRIARVTLRRPDLRIPIPDGFAAAVEGRRIDRIERRAKYLRLHLAGGPVIILHLGMSGRLTITEGPSNQADPHDHVVFEADDGTTVTFNDHRRFGLLTMCPASSLDEHPLFAHLGPEPLERAFDGRALARRLAKKRTPIKAALLDQTVVAGVGNIYACEALFGASLSPRRQAYTVQGGRADKLAVAIRNVLDAAIEAGGSSLRDYVQTSGELGYFQHLFAVYDREGQPCPGCDCSGAIRRITQANRSTFFCPRCQR